MSSLNGKVKVLSEEYKTYLVDKIKSQLEQHCIVKYIDEVGNANLTRLMIGLKKYPIDKMIDNSCHFNIFDFIAMKAQRIKVRNIDVHFDYSQDIPSYDVVDMTLDKISILIRLEGEINCKYPMAQLLDETICYDWAC